MTPYSGFKKVHFVGIGGSGMSGLAEVMAANGFEISGSDKALSSVTEYLSTLGIHIVEGHDTSSTMDYDVVVYSSAVSQDNPELQASMKASIPTIRRAELLGEMMKKKWTIAVSGTHGKTTTTLMLGSIWSQSDFFPTVIGGGTLCGKPSGTILGEGPFLIAEADEYDKSFLQMHPTSLLITNIDNDHLECYGSMENLKAAFLQVAGKVPFCGLSVVNADDPGIKGILPELKGKVIKYGFSSDADYYTTYGDKKELHGFDVYKGESKLAHVDLKVYGSHNVSNALGAFALSHKMGVSVESIVKGLELFGGVSRRLENIGSVDGISFLDDYAHHPSEVRATLSALRDAEGGRIVCVFQPHLFSRTQRFYKEFASAFMNCDKLFVTPVYPSREKPIEGVQGDLIIRESKKMGHTDAHYLKNMNNALDVITSSLEKDDVVITVGAGDIWKLGKNIKENMGKK